MKYVYLFFLCFLFSSHAFSQDEKLGIKLHQIGVEASVHSAGSVGLTYSLGVSLENKITKTISIKNNLGFIHYPSGFGAWRIDLELESMLKFRIGSSKKFYLQAGLGHRSNLFHGSYYDRYETGDLNRGSNLRFIIGVGYEFDILKGNKLNLEFNTHNGFKLGFIFK